MSDHGVTESAVSPTQQGGNVEINTTVLGVVYLFLSIYIIAVNFVEIVIITRIKATSSTVFIASLALTDFTSGVVSILPSSISFLSGSAVFFLGDVMCDITGLIGNTTLLTSLLSVLCISLNRYVALVFPLSYKKISSVQTGVMVTVAIWVISLLRSLSPYYKGFRYIYLEQVGICNYFTSDVFGDQEIYYYALLQVVPFSICFVLLIFCPLHMMILLSRRCRHHHQAAAAVRGLMHQRSDNCSESPSCNTASNNFTSLTSLRRGISFRRSKSSSGKLVKTKQVERDATITTLCVILLFVICYAINYFFICYYFSYLLMDNTWPFAISENMFKILETMWMLMMNLNSMFNPVIYLFRNTAFKAELMTMKVSFEKVFGCSSSSGRGDHLASSRLDIGLPTSPTQRCHTS